MNANDQRLVEEFRTYVRTSFHRDCVTEYLRTPVASAITKIALKQLQQTIDEPGKP
jgi:hypothetical protein